MNRCSSPTRSSPSSGSASTTSRVTRWKPRGRGASVISRWSHIGPASYFVPAPRAARSRARTGRRRPRSPGGAAAPWRAELARLRDRLQLGGDRLRRRRRAAARAPERVAAARATPGRPSRRSASATCLSRARSPRGTDRRGRGSARSSPSPPVSAVIWRQHAEVEAFVGSSGAVGAAGPAGAGAQRSSARAPCRSRAWPGGRPSRPRSMPRARCRACRRSWRRSRCGVRRPRRRGSLRVAS